MTTYRHSLQHNLAYEHNSAYFQLTPKHFPRMQKFNMDSVKPGLQVYLVYRNVLKLLRPVSTLFLQFFKFTIDFLLSKAKEFVQG